MKRDERIDRARGQRMVYERNRRRIIYSQSVCGICGLPVDKSLRYPDQMSATVDHIIPVSKGGTNELANLQLAHRHCNRQKSDKLYEETKHLDRNKKNIQQYIDWSNYRG